MSLQEVSKRYTITFDTRKVYYEYVCSCLCMSCNPYFYHCMGGGREYDVRMKEFEYKDYAVNAITTLFSDDKHLPFHLIGSQIQTQVLIPRYRLSACYCYVRGYSFERWERGGVYLGKLRSPMKHQ